MFGSLGVDVQKCHVPCLYKHTWASITLCLPVLVIIFQCLSVTFWSCVKNSSHFVFWCWVLKLSLCCLISDKSKGVLCPLVTNVLNRPSPRLRKYGIFFCSNAIAVSVNALFGEGKRLFSRIISFADYLGLTRIFLFFLSVLYGE